MIKKEKEMSVSFIYQVCLLILSKINTRSGELVTHKVLLFAMEETAIKQHQQDLTNLLMFSDTEFRHVKIGNNENPI